LGDQLLESFQLTLVRAGPCGGLLRAVGMGGVLDGCHGGEKGDGAGGVLSRPRKVGVICPMDLDETWKMNGFSSTKTVDFDGEIKNRMVICQTLNPIFFFGEAAAR